MFNVYSKKKIYFTQKSGLRDGWTVVGEGKKGVWTGRRVYSRSGCLVWHPRPRIPFTAPTPLVLLMQRRLSSSTTPHEIEAAAAAAARSPQGRLLWQDVRPPVPHGRRTNERMLTVDTVAFILLGSDLTQNIKVTSIWMFVYLSISSLTHCYCTV